MENFLTLTSLNHTCSKQFQIINTVQHAYLCSSNDHRLYFTHLYPYLIFVFFLSWTWFQISFKEIILYIRNHIFKVILTAYIFGFFCCSCEPTCSRNVRLTYMSANIALMLLPANDEQSQTTEASKNSQGFYGRLDEMYPCIIVTPQSYMAWFVFLYLPAQSVFPFPVYPWLQAQTSFDPFMDLHVANLWQVDPPQVSERLHGSIRLESHAVQMQIKKVCEFDIYHSKPCQNLFILNLCLLLRR